MYIVRYVTRNRPKVGQVSWGAPIVIAPGSRPHGVNERRAGADGNGRSYVDSDHAAGLTDSRFRIDGLAQVCG